MYPYGPLMDPYGTLMDPYAYGPPMDSLRTPYGPPMDPLWTPSGCGVCVLVWVLVCAREYWGWQAHRASTDTADHTLSAKLVCWGLYGDIWAMYYTIL